MTPTTGTRRRIGRWSAAIALLVLCAVPAAAQKSPRRAEPPVRFEIRALPIASFEPRNPDRRRFGALEFRGGLELTSSHKDFGGISAIRVASDGARFLAVSDKGRWWRGRIVYNGERPAGIADSEMAPLLGPDGRPLGARGWYDSEALAQDGGRVYVGIERANRIVRFDYARHGLLARGHPIAVPPALRRLPYNGGIECLVFVRNGLPLAGTLIAVSERGRDSGGNILSFLIGGSSAGTFAIRRHDGFDVSDCDVLPNGSLLVLERRYAPLRGVAMRIRRIPLAQVRPGALVDGTTLIEADMGYQIDNMEGLSAHRSAAGEIVLTLVSDDNFSAIQRNILLQFTLVE